jgi:hypothetical protein
MATQNVNNQHNQSYNGLARTGQRLSKTEQKILAVVSKAPESITPKEICEKLNMKSGTVKPVLRIMLHKGILLQPFKGAYCDKITYDVRWHPLLVHNVRLHFKVVERLVHWECLENVGGVSVFVCFGSERNTVSGRLSYDRGMSRPACMLAIDRWISIAEKHLGREINDLVLTTCEVNKDYAGLKIDGGVHCASKKVLRDVLERIYEKEEGVRHEYRLMKNMTLTEFDQIFDKGLDQILGVANNLDNQRELSELRQAQVFMNRRMLETQGSIQAIEKKIIGKAAEEDNVYRLEGLVKDLSERVDVLTKTSESLTQTLLKLLAPKEDINHAIATPPIVREQDYSR